MSKIKAKKSYKDNFIAGVKILMADAQLENYKIAALHIGIAYMSLYKIMDGTRSPTIEQCITLCEKAGYNANWLLMGKGEMYLSKQMTLDEILIILKHKK